MNLLIVVDMQKDFIDGSLGTAEAQAIVPAVKERIVEAMGDRWQVIFTRIPTASTTSRPRRAETSR